MDPDEGGSPAAPSISAVARGAGAETKEDAEKQVLLILVSAPGGGKSTFAEAVLAGDTAGRPWARVCQDTIGKGKAGTKIQCLKAAADAFKEGKSILTDRCNLEREQRSDFVKLGCIVQDDVHAVFLDLPAKQKLLGPSSIMALEIIYVSVSCRRLKPGRGGVNAAIFNAAGGGGEGVCSSASMATKRSWPSRRCHGRVAGDEVRRHLWTLSAFIANRLKSRAAHPKFGDFIIKTPSSILFALSHLLSRARKPQNEAVGRQMIYS
ncbi:hypothetical protein ZWY2020_014535 [Hordeum vulgare]|nr:hypothetical protein ZWY2020_014535 [Hordeum vulgare]